MTLGGAALAARTRAGLTQADVARRVGVQLEVYGRIERGEVFPSVPTLRRLCVTLAIGSDELLGLEGALESRREVGGARALRQLASAARGLSVSQLRLLHRLAESFEPPE
ncbi:MAG TPA: helix-turn-helix transcriptional regulator [Archangium sp.]|jgi:transcriptional regulator with XRE-family HTH domain|uniref:helix-turn-helix transcriptional regulator n=1 Tax=Archangium sp. TaxID=1872627 RepID=UPI002EDAC943